MAPRPGRARRGITRGFWGRFWGQRGQAHEGACREGFAGTGVLSPPPFALSPRRQPPPSPLSRALNLQSKPQREHFPRAAGDDRCYFMEHGTRDVKYIVHKCQEEGSNILD